MFSLPVHVDGEVDVSYIARNTCDKSVILRGTGPSQDPKIDINDIVGLGV